MRCPDRSSDEPGRLQALAEYRIDEEAGLPSLDPIVDMAVRIFDCPAAAVNMIGDDHVFLAANYGIDDYEAGRDVSFCAHAINQNDVMVVEDTALDPRFHDNPAVLSGAIRFYAGIALKAPSGHALGALCLLDHQPHATFPEEDRARLKQLAGMVSDKLELRRLEAIAEAHPSRFEASAETSPNAIICFDGNARISAWNGAATQMFDRTADEMIGQSVDVLIAEEDRGLVHGAIADVLDGAAPCAAATPLTGLRRSGERFAGELHWSRWHEGDAMHFGAIIRDMTEKLREHDALYRLANYDSLTGLPNRNLLHRRLSEALVEGAPTVIVTDLGGFADINNTLGHDAGDNVLCTVAERIRAAVAEPGLVARIGGTVFAILLDERNPVGLHRLTDAVLAAIAQPIVVDGQEVRLAGNCGVAIAPGHGESHDELITSAQLALFQARSSGRGSSSLFTSHLRAEAVARRMYDAELHRALERHQFTLFYQPQVRLADGALVGAEALIRWHHPERGLLLPAAFLPALDGGVLAEPVGRWVLDAACAQAAAWQAFDPEFRMSINLSAAQFRSGDLERQVRDALDRHGLRPQTLELEITENILLHGQANILEQLGAIRDRGIRLSFDDFGTGFASLNLLRDYPVSHIKIDKSFTRLARGSGRDRVIVTSLIDMARQLGIGVIAEGIELIEDAEFLRENGCDEGQGHYFGKAVPPAVFAEQQLRATPRRANG
ncbi:MAG: EAL domain-containing protein [Sphingopyxis sp.]|uniref:putative bifunctional diguanylate cyclase/phosphodiesterase n=1 Tax=Sphingopyxis sp. TaxID=1908224 RepID=UPI001A5EB26C|nr:EAL domain-containing protein [Sphingopyxis sp.]MBL9069444.1 EAL domain-containing protein [Sphingopyxis sp.]